MFLPCKEHSAGAVIPRPPSPVTETLFRAGMALRLRSPSPKPLLIGQKTLLQECQAKNIGAFTAPPQAVWRGQAEKTRGFTPPLQHPLVEQGCHLGRGGPLSLALAPVQECRGSAQGGGRLETALWKGLTILGTEMGEFQA